MTFNKNLILHICKGLCLSEILYTHTYNTGISRGTRKKEGRNRIKFLSFRDYRPIKKVKHKKCLKKKERNARLLVP